MKGLSRLSLIFLAACTHNIGLVQQRPRAVAVTSGGPWASMSYVARTSAGVVVIDLGWMGSGRALRRGLREVGAEPSDVVAVFVTHSHRDHISGWRLLRGARFYMATPEISRFVAGGPGHTGPITRFVERLRRTDRPRPGELRITGFTRDTAIVVGRDTIRAFPVFGHTAGSAAYLFDGILFGGDAVNYRPLRGFRSARPEYSDDAAESRQSLAALWRRLAPHRARIVCTAHGKCAHATEAVIRETLRR